MQLLGARALRRRGSRLSLAAGLLIGGLLLGVGIALGYLALGTSFPERFIPPARPTVPAMAAIALGWTLLLVAPFIAAVAGLAWLAGVVDRYAALRVKPHPVEGLGQVLGDDYAAATGVHLPDGRIVSAVIVGPHGVAVFEPLLPRSLTREHGGRWELRVAANRWVPIENPLERTARSAERVRRWLGAGERDFVVRVHAAVIADDPWVHRTPSCAVITRGQVPSYLASLAIQRGFTPERREQVIETLRAAV